MLVFMEEPPPPQPATRTLKQAMCKSLTKAVLSTLDAEEGGTAWIAVGLANQ
jgi:hypothetical protein